MSCTDDGFEHEVQHVLGLLAETATKPVRASIVDVDEVCRVDSGEGPCLSPIAKAVVYFDLVTCAVICVCERHAQIFYIAINRWRVLNDLPTMGTETAKA